MAPTRPHAVVPFSVVSARVAEDLNMPGIRRSPTGCAANLRAEYPSDRPHLFQPTVTNIDPDAILSWHAHV
jgi:hypothetical protein